MGEGRGKKYRLSGSGTREKKRKMEGGGGRETERERERERGREGGRETAGRGTSGYLGVARYRGGGREGREAAPGLVSRMSGWQFRGADPVSHGVRLVFH